MYQAVGGLEYSLLFEERINSRAEIEDIINPRRSGEIGSTRLTTKQT